MVLERPVLVRSGPSVLCGQSKSVFKNRYHYSSMYYLFYKAEIECLITIDTLKKAIWSVCYTDLQKNLLQRWRRRNQPTKLNQTLVQHFDADAPLIPLHGKCQSGFQL